jgi:biopolymer transport protein ExbD
MSKRIQKKSIMLDMTAMCDMAFLLLTFFILTAQMKPKEPVEINLPSAHASDTVSVKGTIRISIENNGKVYLSLGDKSIRKSVLTALSQNFDLGLEEEHITYFAQADMFGFPLANAKNSLENINNESFKQEGIPTDTTGGELKAWLVASLSEYENNPELLPAGKTNPLVAIHADKNLAYKHLKKVLEVVQSDGVKIGGFKLITNLN